MRSPAVEGYLPNKSMCFNITVEGKQRLPTQLGMTRTLLDYVFQKRDRRNEKLLFTYIIKILTMKEITKKYVDKLTYEIIGAAIEVQKEMGPGLLESIYEQCMLLELKLRGISVVSQKTIPIVYKGNILDSDFRCDLLIENCIVVELKAVSKMTPIFYAQVISYARLLKIPKSVLINFTCRNIFNEGQKTFVNEYYSQLSKGE